MFNNIFSWFRRPITLEEAKKRLEKNQRLKDAKDVIAFSNHINKYIKKNDSGFPIPIHCPYSQIVIDTISFKYRMLGWFVVYNQGQLWLSDSEITFDNQSNPTSGIYAK